MHLHIYSSRGNPMDGILVNNLIANITINSPWHSAKYEISGSQLTYISVYLSFKSHSQFMRLPVRSDRFNIFLLKQSLQLLLLLLFSHWVPSSIISTMHPWSVNGGDVAEDPRDEWDGTNTGVYIDRSGYACPEKNYNFQFNLLFN